MTEEEDSGIKAEEARLKSKAEEKSCLNAEEEDQIAEEARLKVEEHKRTRLKVEGEVLLPLKRDSKQRRRSIYD